jgi:hypothetical protein
VDGSRTINELLSSHFQRQLSAHSLLFIFVLGAKKDAFL